MALANTIRRYRFHNAEMTQKQLAEYVGVSRQTIMAIEANKYPPSLEVAFRIAAVFGVSIEQVFYYEPDGEGEDEFKDRLIVEVQLGGDDHNDGQ